MPSKIATCSIDAVAVRAIELAMTEPGVLQEGLLLPPTPRCRSGTDRHNHCHDPPLHGSRAAVITDVVQKKLEMAQEISGADIALTFKG